MVPPVGAHSIYWARAHRKSASAPKLGGTIGVEIVSRVMDCLDLGQLRRSYPKPVGKRHECPGIDVILR